MRPTRLLVASSLAAFFALLGGCELVADFDRSEIAMDTTDAAALIRDATVVDDLDAGDDDDDAAAR